MAGEDRRAWQSGGVRRDQGIAKSGNPRARRTAIEMAWLWLRHQPGSALARWLHERTGTVKGRMRRIMLVAMARIARAGAALAERLAAIARRRTSKRQTEAFAFLTRAQAQDSLSLKSAQMVSAQDKATSQTAGLDEAADPRVVRWLKIGAAAGTLPPALMIIGAIVCGRQVTGPRLRRPLLGGMVKSPQAVTDNHGHAAWMSMAQPRRRRHRRRRSAARSKAIPPKMAMSRGRSAGYRSIITRSGQPSK